MGRIFFWLLWPLIWMYSPIFRRVRVVVQSGNKVVLVQNNFGPGYWQLPGGGVKLGERLETAAAREIREELGLRVRADDVKALGDVKIVKQFGLLMRYQYAFIAIDDTIDLRLSRELVEAEWVSMKDISKYRSATEVSVGLDLI